MKAKELAEKLLENPEAIVAVWEGEPNDSWIEATSVEICENEFIVTNNGSAKFQKVDKVIKLGYNI